MTKLYTLAFTALFLLLSACGSSDPSDLIKDGQTALGSGDSETALTKFHAAAEGLEPSDPRFIEAKLGVVEALIGTQPKVATQEFLSLGKLFPEQIGEKQYVYISGQLVNSKEYAEAIELVDAGLQRFGRESTELNGLIGRIKMQAASDDAVIDLLAGLGY